MSELDELLTALRDEPAPARFADFDIAVMAGLARHREAQVSRRSLALACLVAALVGVSAMSMSRPSVAAEPLIGIPETAPSHLLID